MKNTGKKTEAQEYIEMLALEIEEVGTPENKAKLIISQLVPLKRAYATRLNEIEAEISASVQKPPKDASVDELLAFNEDRKIKEHQHEVRLNTIDRLDRQVKAGEVVGWIYSTIEVFESMHDMITGVMLEK